MKTTTNKIILAHQIIKIEAHNHTNDVIVKTTAFLNHLAGAKWTTSQIIQEAKLRCVQHKLQNYVLRLGWCKKPTTGVWLFDDFHYDPIHTRKVLDLATGYNSTIIKESKERKEKQAIKSEQMRNAANKRWVNERKKKSEQKKERKIKSKSSFVSKANLKDKFAEYKAEAKDIIGHLDRFIKKYKTETKSKIKSLENFITKQETEITSLKTRLQNKTKEEGYEGAKKLGNQKAINLLNQSIKEKSLDVDKQINNNKELIAVNKSQAKEIDSVVNDRRDLQFRINSVEKDSKRLLEHNKELLAYNQKLLKEIDRLKNSEKADKRIVTLSNTTPHKEINLFWGLLRIYDSK